MFWCYFQTLCVTASPTRGERQSLLHQYAYVRTGFRCIATTATWSFRPLRCRKVAIIISELCNIRGYVRSPLWCPKCSYVSLRVTTARTPDSHHADIPRQFISVITFKGKDAGRSTSRENMKQNSHKLIPKDHSISQ